ncbi:MAG: TetR/AcrR family transcriptional regulator [Deltaproteobacteria bacterium]|nr:TetR/AcrR family transcriptional regulator [Deltaproteobacteria bacterium]
MSSREITVESRKSPGSGREEKKAEVRRRILEASKEIFFRDGFMDANLDEIAELAGVAKGTLYRYFDNKAQIYLAVLSRNAKRFEKKLQGALDPQATPIDALIGVSRFYFQHYVENPDYFQIFWAIENQAVIGELPREVVDEVTRLWEESLGVLAGIIERGIREGVFAPCDAWEVASILWTLANAIIRADHSPAHRSLRRSALDTFFDDAIALVVHGLTQPAACESKTTNAPCS